jgi:ATP-dependent Clp endopeptidase proteolytic subunit ClpP
MKNLTIENKTGKLKLNDSVHKDSADKLIEELGRLYGRKAVDAKMQIGDIVCSADNALELVEVEINSPGGSVMEGTRIYNALREMSARGVTVETTVNGLAASMGSVILMAGDKRKMTKVSQIMIHEASTTAWGDSRAMKRNADLLESISSEIADIYAERTGGDKDAIRNLMYAETWMNADKAIELGFIDEVLDYNKKEPKAQAFDIKTEKPENNHMKILSKLFPNNDQVAEIEAQIAENDNLRNEVSELQAKIESLKDLDQTIIENKVVIDNLTAERDEIKAELDGAKSKIEELENAVPKAVVQELAAIGQPEVIDASEVPAKSIMDTFNELKGAEATKFYKKHRKELLAEQNKLNKNSL